VAIAAAIRAAIPDPRGNNSNQGNCPDWKGRQTRDIVAQKASSREQGFVY
jgi:hypothetical protein